MRKPLVRFGIALLAAVGVIFPAMAAAQETLYPRHLKGPQTLLVSRADGPMGAGANANSKADSISVQGQWVVFDSAASNLPGPNNGVTEVYERNLLTRQTILVSENTAGAPANGNSFGGSVAANGRFIAFASLATNLGTHNQRENVFVRDMQTGETVLISRRSGIFGAEANRNSFGPTMSTDGRFVSFSSDATNLGATNHTTNVYVRGLRSGRTALVSRQSGIGGEQADGRSFEASISPHGRYVVFVSDADNLVPGAPSPGIDEIYVRDRVTHTTTLLSRADGPSGAPANSPSGEPTVSLDGHRVVFSSTATNLVATPVAGSAVREVYLRDLNSDETTLVSRGEAPNGAPANADSGEPVITADGRYVAFASEATNLQPMAVPATAAPVREVYERNLMTGALALVSRANGPGGSPANADSAAPAISPAGHYVAFSSAATNLSPIAQPVINVYRRGDMTRAGLLGSY